ncbi:MAG: beta-mannosidase [Clostridia bacterium]|nr:beta-mannosidase [Clostridia bacterium]
MTTSITPANPNMTAEARAVLAYLHEIRGKGILLGQHTLTMAQEELSHLETLTGKLPALCGFELLSYSPNINYPSCSEAALKEVRENEGTLIRAYEWAERGGLVTMTWHWYSPLSGKDKSFYAENTDFDASRVLIDGTPEREAFFRDMDVMAELLRGFLEKRIPILWRPFHESDGTWFWWGAKGQAVARELYGTMFRYFTDVWHLDHLIWVWNDPTAEFYVGDDYCDIASLDYYTDPHSHTALAQQYERLTAVTKGRPYALGEVGNIPDIGEIAEKEIDWLWFMLWSGEFALTEAHTKPEVFCAAYRHPYAITLDRLPRLY